LEREILTQARAGDSRETIEANLVARFGEGTLGREFRTDVMVGTVVLVVLAVVAIVIVGKRWSRRRPTNSATEGVVKAPNADELASLEAELADVREL
jgi:cytochrome c-type biogenesis protein CcmH/NrfF